MQHNPKLAKDIRDENIEDPVRNDDKRWTCGIYDVVRYKGQKARMA